MGQQANALVHDPARVDRGAHFGPTPFPQTFAPAAAGSVFSNGETHDCMKRWTTGHVIRSSGSLKMEAFANLVLAMCTVGRRGRAPSAGMTTWPRSPARWLSYS
jgi:hypothetical protein